MTDEPKCTYIPDYKTKCQNCDQVPTVQVFINGKLDNHFEMCGPCTFGEAACIDPEEW